MAIYERHFTLAALAAGAVGSQILPAASGEVEVLEVGLFATTAVLSEIGLVRAATLGATPTTSATTLYQALDPGRLASRTNQVGAWVTVPTVSASGPLRAFEIPATIGAGVIYPWGRNELWSVNSATGTLLLQNIGAAASAAIRGYIKIAE